MTKQTNEIISTPEQYQIEHYKGEKLKVRAFAGAGKTTVLVKYALNNSASRILYLAYNRAIRDEAASKFPKNVECKTSHQLAYMFVGKNYGHKLSVNIRLMDIANALDTRNWSLARSVQEALNAFMCSDAERVTEDHIDVADSKQLTTDRQRRYLQEVIEGAQQIWELMIDPESQLPIVHDGYLKLYQLSKPDLSERYKVILFDEAQDANPVTSAIVLRQKTKVILVGDENQQVYRFRGASDALNSDELKGADEMFLTSSFRFGKNVALIANILLKLKSETKEVVGLGGDDFVLDCLPKETKHYTVISRTVAGVLESAIIAAIAGLKVFWVGGMNSYSLQDLLDLYFFSSKETDKIRNKRMMNDYQDFSSYKDVAEETKDSEMMRLVRLLKTYKDIPRLVDLLKAHEADSEKYADITVTTAHKSKGLEWDTVMLGDDFPDVLDKDLSWEARSDEINLLYVVVTRAMRVLIVNTPVMIVIKNAMMQRYLAEKQEII